MSDEDTSTKTDKSGASENGASSSSGAKTTPSAPPTTALEEFSTILHSLDGDEDEGDHGDDDDESQTDDKSGKSKKPKTFADLAKALNVKESDLYGIEVPSSRAGEKPFSLGKLKDLMKERDDFAVASLKLDDDRRVLERDRVAAEDQFKELLAQLPAESLKPENAQKIRGILEARRAQARALIIENIPEWKDPVVRESELKAITEHLKGYGIRGETFVLANFDHGVLRFVRDAVKLADKVKTALATVEERRGKTPPTSKKAGAKKTAPKSAPGRVEGEVSAFRQAFTDYHAKSH